VEGWLKLVKVFVVVAGVVLVVGTALLIGLLVQRAGRAPADLAAPSPLRIPPAMRVEEVTLGGERLLLTLRDSQGVLHLLVVDAASGRTVGFLRVEPGS